MFYFVILQADANVAHDNFFIALTGGLVYLRYNDAYLIYNILELSLTKNGPL